MPASCGGPDLRPVDTPHSKHRPCRATQKTRTHAVTSDDCLNFLEKRALRYRELQQNEYSATHD